MLIGAWLICDPMAGASERDAGWPAVLVGAVTSAMGAAQAVREVLRDRRW